MRLSKREKVLLGILLVVGGFYVFYQFEYFPRQVTIDRLKEENTRLNREIVSFIAKEGGLTDINQEKRRLNDELDQMVIRLPRSPLLADIVAFLEQSARDSQVKLASVNYKESLPSKTSLDAKDTNPVKPAQYVNFQLTASGDHAGLLSFLLKIENASRIYNINSGKISLLKRKQPEMAMRSSESESGALGRAGEATVAEQESLTYDRNNLVIVLDISAYYDQSSVRQKIN